MASRQNSTYITYTTTGRNTYERQVENDRLAVYDISKNGSFHIRGGYALVPVIEREIVEKRKWLQSEEVADIVAVSGSVPGAVAVNSATLIGYRIAGIGGALSALLGIFLPTFALMIGLSLVYVQMKDNPKIEAAFLSIRATVVAMIVYAAFKIGKPPSSTSPRERLRQSPSACCCSGETSCIPPGSSSSARSQALPSSKSECCWAKDEARGKEPVYDYMI